jgi:hypothetical protein
MKRHRLLRLNLIILFKKASRSLKVRGDEKALPWRSGLRTSTSSHTNVLSVAKEMSEEAPGGDCSTLSSFPDPESNAISFLSRSQTLRSVFALGVSF